MDKYYYLIAQLPFLQFGQPPGLEKEVFLEEAHKWLAEADFRELEVAGFDIFEQIPRTSFLKEYKDFELNLRKQLLSYRKSSFNKNLKKTEKKQGEYGPGGPLSKGILEGNPLEIEKKLYFLRWQKIDELSQSFVFSREAVIAYFLKLQILEKLFEFDKEKGREKFDSLTKVKDEKIR